MNELLYQVVLTAAGAIITACVTYATKKAMAWLKKKDLYDEVENAVCFAEQICKSGKISLGERKDYALKYLKERGVGIDEGVLDMLIESVIGGINIGLGKTATETSDE